LKKIFEENQNLIWNYDQNAKPDFRQGCLCDGFCECKRNQVLNKKRSFDNDQMNGKNKKVILEKK